jgi:uncharacterized phage protein (TIGR02218 family)
MRDIPPALAARLNSGATTLCHVWKLTRADGLARGFTDHDRDLTIDGLVYAARSALAPSEIEAALGLAVTGGEVAGALSDASLTEGDLSDGLYDGARVETWLVDWSEPTLRALVDVSSIGEVKRSLNAFTAELRSLAHQLDQPSGRIYQSSCAADLGDARCGVDLTSAQVSIEVALGASTAGRLVCATHVLPGARAGARRRIRRHAGGALDLWTPLGGAPAAGDRVRLVVGCDKRFATCHARFANAANFRGFPHMPGNDYVLRYAAPGEAGQGGEVAR